ncbi:hypothetical protein F4774DRAFT_414764 [Daldinia eschscholtzii]|nr:hypothetical protein F4774DRAFT_414764 [Daldinia eschscholtzii]
MSGVRNLRAMFEQKGENNPPERGRSPGPSGVSSVGSPSPTLSPRPLSKVRTTFVAIEKDGRVGLRREPSGDSVSVSSRRLSDETDATTPQPVPEKPEALTEIMAKNISTFKPNLSQESIPESPVSAAPPKSPPKSPPKKQSPKQSPSPALAPNPNPDKVTDEEETKTKLLPGNPTEKSVSRGSSVAPASGRSSVSANSSKAKTATATKPAPKAVSTTTKSVSRAPKSPNTLKPTSNTTKPVSKPTSSTSSLASQKRSTPASSREREAPKKATTTTASKPAATSTKKPAPTERPASGAGFVKPKPKSPTRPVKLPSSLTAPTASSASKLGSTAAQPPRQSLSRASGNAQHLNVSSTTHRSPSRQSLSSFSTTSNTNGLKRQNSAASRPRPSFGPPPKPAAKDHPIIKRDGHVDEGFLARMMRPTQASSSKTADKAPVTPPRKQNTPSAASHKKSSVVRDAEGHAKKAASKVQSATNKAKAATEQTKPAAKKTPTAKEVAPVVAQAKTAEAAIETAKVSTDTATKEESVSEKSPKQVATAPAVTEDPEKVEDIEDVVQPTLEPAAEIYAAKSETEDVRDGQSVSEGANEVAVQSEAASTTEEVKVEEQSKEETF